LTASRRLNNPGARRGVRGGEPRQLAGRRRAAGAAACGRARAGEPGPTYPLAVAAASACHGVPLALALPAYRQAFAANLVSAAVRLVPLGQTDGQRAVAALEPVVAEVASRAPACPLDELGTATLMVDLGSTRHETQHTRLFRS
jgi:urease accessory protein UreF